MGQQGDTVYLHSCGFTYTQQERASKPTEHERSTCVWSVCVECIVLTSLTDDILVNIEFFGQLNNINVPEVHLRL